ncbi:MAG: hypothetical protein AAGB02_04480 [Pseudomonadota bacterium]
MAREREGVPGPFDARPNIESLGEFDVKNVGPEYTDTKLDLGGQKLGLSVAKEPRPVHHVEPMAAATEVEVDDVAGRAILMTVANQLDRMVAFGSWIEVAVLEPSVHVAADRPYVASAPALSSSATESRR